MKRPISVQKKRKLELDILEVELIFARAKADGETVRLEPEKATRTAVEKARMKELVRTYGGELADILKKTGIRSLFDNPPPPPIMYIIPPVCIK